MEIWVESVEGLCSTYFGFIIDFGLFCAVCLVVWFWTFWPYILTRNSNKITRCIFSHLNGVDFDTCAIAFPEILVSALSFVIILCYHWHAYNMQFAACDLCEIDQVYRNIIFTVWHSRCPALIFDVTETAYSNYLFINHLW